MTNIISGSFPRISHLALILTGVIATFLALTCSVPIHYAAPVEWLGVFCMMTGLTLLCSARLSLVLVSAAAVLGISMDPILMGAPSPMTWVYANVLVLIFGSAGTFAGSLLARR